MKRIVAAMAFMATIALGGQHDPLNRERMMKRVVITAVTLLLALSTGFGSWSCSPKNYSGPVESITIGIMANAGDTLIFVAAEEGYLTANGLDVTLKTYINGLAATDAMLEGEADLAYATEFVVVGKALQSQKTSIITTYSKNDTVSLAGRKDRGIDWMIRNNLTPEKQVPNFLDYIYEDGLKAIKPDAVSIIR